MAQTAEITRLNPLDVRKSGYGSLLELLAIEGDPLPSTPVGQNLNPSTQSVPVSVGSLAVPPPGRAYFVQEATISGQTAASGRLQQNPTSGINGIGTYPYLDIGWASTAFAPDRKTLNLFLRSSAQYAGSSLSAIISAFRDTTPTSAWFGVGFTGFQLADDLNFNADKTILVLGDSRNNGSGPTTVDLAPAKVITNYYRGKGIDARYILKAYSGSTSRGHDTLIKRGVYDGFSRVDLIVYDLGTNDAVQGYNPATDTVANLARFVAWRNRFHSTAKILVIGSPPLQGANETALDTIRSAESVYVDGLADPTVKFFSYKNAFDRTDGTNYLTSDGPDGTRVHPTDKGLTSMYNGGYSGFIGLLAWLDANMPSI